MAERRVPNSSRRRPGTTPERYNNQVVAAAYRLAEDQILSGEASAQVITHFLKEGSPRTQLELQRLENENALLKARVEQIKAAQNFEEMAAKAYDAIKTYQGHSDDDEIEYDGRYDDDR